MMDKWINNNTISKILALAIAAMLWGMVHLDAGTPSSPMTVSYTSKVIDNVKIEAVGLDESKYVLEAMDTDHVKMEVRGQRSVITSFFADNYKVRVDLSGLGAETKTLQLAPDLPTGVEMVSMTPEKVTVTIEKKQTKSFDVSILSKGAPASGLLLGTPVIDPKTVQVTLPESQLKTVATVQGTVETDGVSEQVESSRVKLKAYNKKGQELKGAVIEPSSVAVVIPVTQQYKSVPVKVTYTGELPDGLVLSKVSTNVKVASVFAPQSALAGLSSFVTVTLDLSQLTEAGTHDIQANLAPPTGAEKIEPSTVQIQVTVAPYNEVSDQERTIQKVPITLKGSGSGARTTIVSPVSKTLDVTVKGPQDMVNDLTNSDITLVADVTGLLAGRHDVTLEVGLPKYITSSGDSSQLTAIVNIENTVPPNQNSGENDGGSTGANGQEQLPDKVTQPPESSGTSGNPSNNAEGTAEEKDRQQNTDNASEGSSDGAP